MRSHLPKQLEIRQGGKGTVPPSPPHCFADPNISFCFQVIFQKFTKFTKIGLRLATLLQIKPDYLVFLHFDWGTLVSHKDALYYTYRYTYPVYPQ